MRILLCHPGHSFSTSDVFDGLLTGLTAAGADVVTFRWDQIMQRLGAFVAGAAAAGVVRPDQQERAHDFMAWLAAADALSLAVEYEVDAVLVITGTLFPPSRLKPLRKLGIPVACYGTEAPYFEETERAMAPFYTHWFTQERTSVPVYASAVPGGRAFYLPMAYNPATHAPAPPDPAYACDVSFVGGGYRERRAMFPGLAWAGVNTHGRWMPDIDLQVRGTLWHLDLDAEQGATGGSRGSRYAEGSCLVSFGYTRVLCTATLEKSVPPFLKGKGEGWVTAEYNMLPRATHTRSKREREKVGGRTAKIQRLIGRALRAVVDLEAMGEIQVKIDPAKLRGLNLSVLDVNAALRAQNAQVSAGALGALPNLSEQTMTATVVVNGQLSSVEQFGNVVLRYGFNSGITVSISPTPAAHRSRRGPGSPGSPVGNGSRLSQ